MEGGTFIPKGKGLLCACATFRVIYWAPSKSNRLLNLLMDVGCAHDTSLLYIREYTDLDLAAINEAPSWTK